MSNTPQSAIFATAVSPVAAIADRTAKRDLRAPQTGAEVGVQWYPYRATRRTQQRATIDGGRGVSEMGKQTTEARTRIAKADERQLSICIEQGVWGQSRNRFRDWRKGDFLLIISETGAAALGLVCSDPFVSEDLIFEKQFFPYRIGIQFVHFVGRDDARSLKADIESTLKPIWGNRYGFPILLQLLLTADVGQRILQLVQSRPNSLPQFQHSL